jgi:L-lactate dehydrogenase (cytochrome)
MGLITGEEVAKHNSKDSCWVVIESTVYDVTRFLPQHPGGPAKLLKYAGGVRTIQYIFIT